jgi:hypothetical protein
MRCRFTFENWTHIWICRENDITIQQIIDEAFERLKEKLDSLEIRVGFNYHARLHHILNQISFVVFNGKIFHEAIKGLVNNQLYMDISDSNFRDGIRQFVKDIQELARMYIWNERCTHVRESMGKRTGYYWCKKDHSFIPSFAISSKIKDKFT